MVTLGEATTVYPVAELRLEEGDQEYVLAPLAVNVYTLLAQLTVALVGVTETFVTGFTVTEIVAAALQLLTGSMIMQV